jgi:hypothetical protein
MRTVAAALAIAWALANLAAAWVMLTGAFVSKTAMKEGILSQAALLLGGAGIEALSIVLIWQSVRMVRR